MQAAAVEAVLDLPEGGRVVGAEQGGPATLEGAAQACRGDGAFEEEGGEDGGDEGLEDLEDEGGELVEAGGEGRRGGGGGG